MIGERIGNFKIVSLLGTGGMGEVYLGEHEKIGTRVAVKVLLSDISVNKDHVERFFNEAVAVSKIQHVGIGKIFDVGFHGSRAYLIMEYLPGETLATRIHRVGRLSIPHAAEIGKQMCLVLEAVHQAGITHRDLKPENVFLVPDAEIGERVRIVDFGIAKLTGTGGGLTATGFGAMGTPAYMSPEQWKNSKTVDWRADAYSLGCLTFEMIAGRQVFPFETIGEACARHMGEEAPRLASIVSVPPSLDHLIARLLAKLPEHRPQSMREIANGFTEAASAAISSPSSSPSSSPAIMAPTVVGVPQRAPQLSTLHDPRMSAEQPVASSGAPRRVTPRMIPVQTVEGMVPQQPSNPRLIPIPPAAAKGPNKGLVVAVIGIAVVGGAAAVILTRGGKDKEPEKEKAKPTEVVSSKKKWKTNADGSNVVLAEADPPKTGSTVRAGSGSSRPPPIPGLQVEVDSTLVSEAFAPIKPEVRKCKTNQKVIVKVAVAVNPDGSIASADVKPSPHADEAVEPALANCVVNLVKTARFKKTQFGGTFVYPFVF